MADSKLSDLTSVSALSGAELFYVVQGGADRKATADQIKTFTGGVTGSTATIDFGVFPGASDTSLAITGQAGIVSGSIVKAWIQPASTSDHSADEHIVEPIRVYAGNISPGTGFTIYAVGDNRLTEPLESPGVSHFKSAATSIYGLAQNSVGGKLPMTYGQWNVAWEWF